MNRLAFMLLVAVSFFGCSSGTPADNVIDGVDQVDGRADAKVPVEVLFVTDTGTGDVAPDVKGETVDAVKQDAPPLQCDPGEGCFMDGCTGNGDCQSSWCVEHMGEQVCTQPCQEECPPGWSCSQVAGTDPDLVFVCVSDHPNICRPCTEADDCTGLAGTEDACVAYGEQGSFCGGECGDGGECPWGFECEDVTTVDGIELQQCVAVAGECPCTGTSVALGLFTSCQVANDFGACDGKRVCKADGLSECDAEVPAEEECNEVDDDCDGEIDEDTCDDGNPCTEDSCAGAEGCEHVAVESGECMDGDPCTKADHCEQGVCVGELVDCADDNPCTDDFCTELGGCEHEDNNEECDDDDPCTLGDECKGGECKGIEVPCDCLVDEDCAALEDGDICNGTLVCDTSELPFECLVDPATIIDCPQPSGESAFCLKPSCDSATGDCDFVPDHQGLLCEDGDECVVNAKCSNGLCTGGDQVNCNDGNICTDDSCNAETGCVHDNNAADCSDGDICTDGDVCIDGKCTGGPPVQCDDGDLCNGAEECVAPEGCVDGVPLDCDDENPCNGIEFCDPGLGCQTGEGLDCDDINPCTTDSCDPVGGCVHDIVDGAQCDDENACTLGDICAEGACVGAESMDCSDDNPCTDDVCVPAEGCVVTLNNAVCDDQNVCTIGDQCHLGDCTGSGELVCDDGNQCTDDFCDPGEGCVHDIIDGGQCDDADACTLGDTCVMGVCVGPETLDCSDDNPCTDEACIPEEGCVVTLNNAVCDDEDVCSVGDHCHLGDCTGGGELVCDDGNECTDDACEPAVGCQFAPNQGGCDDGSPCTVGDTCAGGGCAGVAVDCDDDNECTVDQCDEGDGCQNVPIEDGTDCGGEGSSCQQGICGCSPACEGKVCGDDGCGGNCGECGQIESCVTGHCVPEHLWSNGYGGTLWDYVESVAVAADGTVFVSGQFISHKIDFGCGEHENNWPGKRDAYIVALDSDGDCVWSRTFGADNNDFGLAIAITPDQMVCVVGTYHNGVIDPGAGPLPAALGIDTYLACYAADGQPLWSLMMSPNKVEDLAAGPDGNLYVIGKFGGATYDCSGIQVENPGSESKFAIWVAKLRPSGTPEWCKAFGGSGNDSGLGIATTVDGYVWLTGDFESPTIDFGGGDLENSLPGKKDAFLVKLDSNGSYVASFRYGEESNDSITHVRSAGGGAVRIGGYFESEAINLGGLDLVNSKAGTPDLFVASLTGVGLHEWSMSFGGTGNDDLASLAVDHLGDSYVAGSSQSQELNLGGGNVSPAKMYYARLDVSGSHVWSKGNPNMAGGHIVATAPNGDIVLAGRYYDSVTLGGEPLPGVGETDVFVSRFAQYGPECVPSCDDKQCGTDGCAGNCGQCPDVKDACVLGSCTCQPECEGKECGDDGCGGDCGACVQDESCIDGLCSDIGLVWKPIPSGTFTMGCSPGDGDCESNEKPAHSVTLSQFKMLETEVTEGQYEAVMGEDPSCDCYGGGGPDSPVECVDWYEAKAFCEAVGGRLCSEAEWEYAARGGTTSKSYCGNSAGCLDGIAWWLNNSGNHKHDVKGKAPNAYGLYDMLGNVDEQTADWFSGSYYDVSPANNPTGPNSGVHRVARGLSFGTTSAVYLRVSYRNKGYPSGSSCTRGIRCCKSPDE